jgi:hypothetical protein
MGYLMLFIFITMRGFGLAADVPASSNNMTQAIFTQVRGNVQVLVPHHTKPKKAQKDLVVTQGDRIVTQEDSSAVLRLFDGSELKIDSKTEFVLSEMQKPSDVDKNFKFSLFIGKLAAVVKKLTSASSSFEIEAGGVVCGVRGTQFEMGYNPRKNAVSLNVVEGSVWARSNGGAEHVFRAGQQQIFNNVHPNSPTGSNSQNTKGSTGTNNSGNSGSGSNSSNNSTGGNGGSGNSGDSGNGSSGSSTGGNLSSGSTGGNADSGNGTAGGNSSTGSNSSNLGNGGSASSPTGSAGSGVNPLADPALQVMTTNVQKIISVNNNNTLNTTQQNTSIALHVGPGEVIP